MTSGWAQDSLMISAKVPGLIAMAVALVAGSGPPSEEASVELEGDWKSSRG